MKFSLLVVLFSLFQLHQSFAQLPNFTQYGQNQLNINPAFAGYFDEDLKFDAVYRKQSYSGLITTSFYNADLQLKPFKEYISEQDVLGLGFNMYSTKSLSIYSQQSASASFSYSKGFDEEANQSLALGFQLRYNSKRIDYTQLLFPNQFDLIGYNFQIPNNEPIQAINAQYIDINTGLLYSIKNENEEFIAGFSMYNLNQSTGDKSLMQNRQSVTYMFNTGYSKYITNNSQLFLGLLYSTLKTQHSTAFIASYGYDSRQDLLFNLNIGTILQVDNLISPFISIGSNKMKFSFTYDIPINSNITYMKSNSLEFGFQYSFIRLSEEESLVKRHISCFK
jgi:type IX secretion system PorP/SprF family membrane protein